MESEIVILSDSDDEEICNVEKSTAPQVVQTPAVQIPPENLPLPLMTPIIQQVSNEPRKTPIIRIIPQERLRAPDHTYSNFLKRTVSSIEMAPGSSFTSLSSLVQPAVPDPKPQLPQLVRVFSMSPKKPKKKTESKKILQSGAYTPSANIRKLAEKVNNIKMLQDKVRKLLPEGSAVSVKKVQNPDPPPRPKSRVAKRPASRIGEILPKNPPTRPKSRMKHRSIDSSIDPVPSEQSKLRPRRPSSDFVAPPPVPVVNEIDVKLSRLISLIPGANQNDTSPEDVLPQAVAHIWELRKADAELDVAIEEIFQQHLKLSRRYNQFLESAQELCVSQPTPAKPKPSDKFRVSTDNVPSSPVKSVSLPKKEDIVASVNPIVEKYSEELERLQKEQNESEVSIDDFIDRDALKGYDSDDPEEIFLVNDKYRERFSVSEDACYYWKWWDSKFLKKEEQPVILSAMTIDPNSFASQDEEDDDVIIIDGPDVPEPFFEKNWNKENEGSEKYDNISSKLTTNSGEKLPESVKLLSDISDNVLSRPVSLNLGPATDENLAAQSDDATCITVLRSDVIDTSSEPTPKELSALPKSCFVQPSDSSESKEPPQIPDIEVSNKALDVGASDLSNVPQEKPLKVAAVHQETPINLSIVNKNSEPVARVLVPILNPKPLAIMTDPKLDIPVITKKVKGQPPKQADKPIPPSAESSEADADPEDVPSNSDKKIKLNKQPYRRRQTKAKTTVESIVEPSEVVSEPIVASNDSKLKSNISEECQSDERKDSIKDVTGSLSTNEGSLLSAEEPSTCVSSEKLLETKKDPSLEEPNLSASTVNDTTEVSFTESPKESSVKLTDSGGKHAYSRKKSRARKARQISPTKEPKKMCVVPPISSDCDENSVSDSQQPAPVNAESNIFDNSDTTFISHLKELTDDEEKLVLLAKKLQEDNSKLLAISRQSNKNVSRAIEEQADEMQPVEDPVNPGTVSSVQKEECNSGTVIDVKTPDDTEEAPSKAPVPKKRVRRTRSGRVIKDTLSEDMINTKPIVPRSVGLRARGRRTRQIFQELPKEAKTEQNDLDEVLHFVKELKKEPEETDCASDVEPPCKKMNVSPDSVKAASSPVKCDDKIKIKEEVEENSDKESVPKTPRPEGNPSASPCSSVACPNPAKDIKADVSKQVKEKPCPKSKKKTFNSQNVSRDINIKQPSNGDTSQELVEGNEKNQLIKESESVVAEISEIGNPLVTKATDSQNSTPSKKNPTKAVEKEVMSLFNATPSKMDTDPPVIQLSSAKKDAFDSSSEDERFEVDIPNIESDDEEDPPKRQADVDPHESSDGLTSKSIEPKKSSIIDSPLKERRPSSSKCSDSEALNSPRRGIKSRRPSKPTKEQQQRKQSPAGNSSPNRGRVLKPTEPEPPSIHKKRKDPVAKPGIKKPKISHEVKVAKGTANKKKQTVNSELHSPKVDLSSKSALIQSLKEMKKSNTNENEKQLLLAKLKNMRENELKVKNMSPEHRRIQTALKTLKFKKKASDSQTVGKDNSTSGDGVPPKVSALPTSSGLVASKSQEADSSSLSSQSVSKTAAPQAPPCSGVSLNSATQGTARPSNSDGVKRSTPRTSEAKLPKSSLPRAQESSGAPKSPLRTAKPGPSLSSAQDSQKKHDNTSSRPLQTNNEPSGAKPLKKSVPSETFPQKTLGARPRDQDLRPKGTRERPLLPFPPVQNNSNNHYEGSNNMLNHSSSSSKNPRIDHRSRELNYQSDVHNRPDERRPPDDFNNSRFKRRNSSDTFNRDQFSRPHSSGPPRQNCEYYAYNHQLHRGHDEPPSRNRSIFREKFEERH